MNKRKTIEDLTIQDNFMFAAVMMTDTENCRKVIEYAPGINVDRIEVVPEKTIIYHPEYKGIRLDVYAKEVAGDKVPRRHFNLEMQIGNKRYSKGPDIIIVRSTWKYLEEEYHMMNYRTHMSYLYVIMILSD